MKKALIFSMICILGLLVSGINAMEMMEVTAPEHAAKVTFQSLAGDQVLVSVTGMDGNPVMGLQAGDFALKQGNRSGKIISVTALEKSEDIALNTVLVVDNSFSMKQRKAVQPLLKALEEFYSIVRPVDNVHAVVFDETGTITVRDRSFRVKTHKPDTVEGLRSFFNDTFADRMTRRTYLYDGIYAGLDIISQMPVESNKFLVVFTDGEDIGSSVRIADLLKEAEQIENLTIYAVDFTEEKSVDFFLKSFAEGHRGQIWKADSSAELPAVFSAFSKALRHQYILTYRFLDSPKGTLALEPSSVTIEEVTTVESVPLLNYVFFKSGEGMIPSSYALFTDSSDVKGFSEKNLDSPMDSYRNILNIIGSRLAENPEATITLVGTNSDMGMEKGNMALSRQRAEAVQSYLNNIWGISSDRMEVQARNLPEVVSAISTPEGISENQRVEIHSSHPAILDTVNRTYVQTMADAKTLSVIPRIQAEAGIDKWKLELKGEDDTVIETTSGTGDISKALTFNLVPAGLSKIASFKNLTASVEVTDREGEVFRDSTSAATKVRFIKKEEMMAQKQGNRVLEKYALILFDFDSDALRERNRAVVDRIVARLKALPDAKVSIVGHTDTIGQEKYNINLSRQRARAVLKQIAASGVDQGENVELSGVGPFHPLYSNTTPEGRAMNRTVTITLDYEKKM